MSPRDMIFVLVATSSGVATVLGAYRDLGEANRELAACRKNVAETGADLRLEVQTTVLE